MAFQKVGGLYPNRSIFNLSHDRKFDCDMGELIPVLVEDCIPGDVFSIKNEVVIRFHQSLFAPLLHEVNVYTHYFFVPYRILWQDNKLWFGHELTNAYPDGKSFERYISGGVSGNESDALPRASLGLIGAYSRLADFLYGIDTSIISSLTNIENPSLLPWIAYFRIYNEFYRNQTFINEKDTVAAGELLKRSWERDYFTSALPSQQRGTAPALPISGFTKALWVDADFNAAAFGTGYHGNQLVFESGAANNVAKVNEQVGFDNFSAGNAQSVANVKGFLNNNNVNLGSAITFGVTDIRYAVQTQKWMERNMRAGVRYTELLGVHFGVQPRDDRLDRPEYIGGSKAPVIFSEVLQTSETADTPQGHLAGHGISVNRQFVSKYRVLEYGCIIGIMSVVPRTAYQQGINRQWLKDSKYDFYWPEFAHLSEQPVWTEEIYLNNTSAGTNRTVFGYQGRYDEYRYRPSTVHGNLRSSLDYWHLGRQFSSTPALNEAFLECVPRKDIFPAPSLPGMLVNFGNIITAARPMPVIADPGLLDHF